MRSIAHHKADIEAETELGFCMALDVIFLWDDGEVWGLRIRSGFGSQISSWRQTRWNEKKGSNLRFSIEPTQYFDYAQIMLA